ncbi:hypothetical protein BLNAU_6981 [Blattamonas nauphoetae]|uniref:Sugar phosphate transporter domain-containing protein n=1 Tax=Blattamonas nauphoetae TaxID=2049346 RepID=A0ABQ9Y2W0_9EUKA|nr:hypothetical protein BLNAU_6981 [Blattamonas nauphoetae]
MAINGDTQSLPSAESNNERSASSLAVMSILYLTAAGIMQHFLKSTFPYPSFINVSQSLVIIIVTIILSCFTGSYPPLSMEKLRITSPIILTSIFISLSTFYSLSRVSVSTLTVLHLIGLYAIIFSDQLFFGRRFGHKTIGAFSLILLGNALFYYVDFHFSFRGLFWGLINVLAQTSQTVYLKYLSEKRKLHKTELSFYNAVHTLPSLLVLLLLTHETSKSLPKLLTLNAIPFYLLLALTPFVSNIRFESLKNLSITGWELLNLVGPLPSAILGLLVPQILISPINIGGLLLIILGIYLYQRYSQRDDTFHSARGILRLDENEQSEGVLGMTDLAPQSDDMENTPDLLQLDPPKSSFAPGAASAMWMGMERTAPINVTVPQHKAPTRGTRMNAIISEMLTNADEGIGGTQRIKPASQLPTSSPESSPPVSSLHDDDPPFFSLPPSAVQSEPTKTDEFGSGEGGLTEAELLEILGSGDGEEGVVSAF